VQQLSTDSIYVSFPLEDGTFENLHAKRISEDVYELDNSPFYVYDISFKDKFSIKIAQDRILFNEIISRSGHSTYRIKILSGKLHDDFLEFFDDLKKIGCSFEGSNKSEELLYSIDVPSSADIKKVYDILEKKEKDGFWQFEEAHFFKGFET
jgi:Domain of unknown function (DUF4265)